MVAAGQNEGAKLQTGGKQFGTEGFFFEPTVFSDVTDNMTIAKEEIFGPVQSILKFSTLEEVIERANNTNYGLASGVLTKNIDTALNFAKAVEAGSVWYIKRLINECTKFNCNFYGRVNCYDAVASQTPFGGYKMSGVGRELGPGSVERYMETKTIVMKLKNL